MTPQEIATDLRDEADDIARDLDDVPPHETIGGQAAQTIEEFAEALTRIAEGAPDPRGIAEDALSLRAPLRPYGDIETTVRNLLKPRRS